MKLKNILKDACQNLLEDKIKLALFVFYVIMLGFCYLVFQQSDLMQTSTSSYAYLRGHFLDFYNYNKKIVGGDDYYALMYIIFAIWNIPLKILGFMHSNSQGILLDGRELLWTKLLLVVFFFATAYATYKVAELILKDKSNKAEKAKLIGMIFATSPIAIFIVFCFGQYDIIGLFFSMVGIYYYIKKDYMKFAIAFSLAISLKFFAIFIFVPLVLLSNKKIWNIIKYLFIGLLSTAIQIAMYYNNIAFREQFFRIASGEANDLQSLNLSQFNNSPYLYLAFFAICIFAYIKKAKDDDEFNMLTVFICLISYGALFSTVIWHPQWLIIILPFFALSYIFINEREKMYLFDIVGMLAFIYLSVNFFAGNVDVIMAKYGVLRRLFNYIPLELKDFYFPKFVPIVEGIFFLYLFSPIMVYYYGKYNKNDISKKVSSQYFFSRLFLGMAVFLVPAVLCIVMPKNLARIIDKSAYSTPGMLIESPNVTYCSINSKSDAEQTFYAGQDYFREINVKLGTFQKVNQCNLTFSLYDENMKLIASSTADGSKIKDNSFYQFIFNPIENSKGKKYTLKIQSDGDLNNSIALWISTTDIYPQGTFEINNNKVSSDMDMQLFYDMR